MSPSSESPPPLTDKAEAFDRVLHNSGSVQHDGGEDEVSRRGGGVPIVAEHSKGD